MTAVHAHSSAHEPQEERLTVATWEGGGSPFAAPWPKVMMWLFLLSDALTFSGLLGGYGYVRSQSPSWPDQSQIFNLGLVGLMTFILICSSATMAAAVTAAQRGQREATLRLLLLTVLGGAVFLGLQAYEWTHFIHDGARLWGNPWGVPLFSSSFFVITGFHGFHVLSGVLYLTAQAIKVARGTHSSVGVEVAGLYWHFVDLVWVFIFTFMYLI